MKTRRIIRTLLLSMVLAVAITGLFLTAANGKGKNKMEITYDDKGNMTLNPQIYRTGKGSSVSLFPVPQDNAVGTNDYREAITVFSFPRGKIELDHYFKNSVASLSGSGVYLPVISPDLIGFGQMRRFMLFDFKSKKHEQYAIAFTIDEAMFKIAVADAEKRRFLFEVKEYNRHSVDAYDSTYFLQLIDLSEKKVNLKRK